MKNILKKFAIVAALVVLAVGCGTSKKAVDATFGASMREYTMKATMVQVDSMITVDALPNFNNWTKVSYKDFETGGMYVKRIYTRGECTYVVIGEKEPFEVSKRISK